MTHLIQTFILCTLIINQVWAQKHHIYRVHQGEVPTKVIPHSDQYRYDHFKKGLIHFYDGNSISAKLNYNYLYKKMQGLTDNGDTVDIKFTYATNYIEVGDKLFFRHPKGDFLEIEKGSDPLRLAVIKKVELIIVEDHMLNGYAQRSHDYKLLSHRRDEENPYLVGNIYDWPTREELLFKKETLYFLMDHNGRLHAMKWKNLRRIFPDDKQKLKKYIQDQQIDFKRKPDLGRLIAYCEKLLS